MAEITTDGPVNVSHLAHLLAGSLREEGLRVVGPDEDGQTRIRAHGVGEDRLRELLAQADPDWTPPVPAPDPEDAPALTPRQLVRAIAAVTGKTPRQVAEAFRAAAEQRT